MFEKFPKFEPTPDAVQPTAALETQDKEIFEKKFGPKDYIKTYYPEHLDTHKLLWASRMIREDANADRVDIRKIVGETNVSHEAAENLMVFDFQRSVAKKLLEAFPEDNIKVLDVGGGPTIYQHIAISLEAGHITHSEFLEQNRQEVSRWVNNEEGAYNWDAYFDLVKKMLQEDTEFQATLQRQLESDNPEISSHAQAVKNLLENPDLEDYKAYLRERLGNDIVLGDVFRQDLGFSKDQSYDVVSSSREGAVEMVTSNFTVESATGDRSKWEQGMKNIMARVKPNGFLALTAIRNAEWYQVGDEKMPAVKITEDDIRTICKQEGFDIADLRVLEGSDKNKVGYDGMIFVFARKIL